MYQQVEYDSSLIESISSYLLDDHSENFFDEHNLVGFPAIAPEWSVDIHPEMSSIFVANSSSCAIDSTSSGLINPYFMDEPIDPLPDFDDFDIYGLLNELIPTTNIPSLESDLSQTFLPSTENENNSDDVQNSKAPTSDRRKYRGVVKRPREKFTAEMRNPEKKGAKIWLGTYETPEEAAMAYDRTAFKIRGAQALLNFPHLVHSHNENPEKYIIKKRSIASTSTSSSSSSSNSLKDGQRKRRIYKLG